MYKTVPQKNLITDVQNNTTKDTCVGCEDCFSVSDDTLLGIGLFLE